MHTGLSPHGAITRGLYLVTPDEPDTARLLDAVAPLLPFTRWLQYRNKAAAAGLRRRQVRALMDLCVAARVPLIVNDDWRLAIDEGAAGAHLGVDDTDLSRVRQAAGPSLLLGASCYADPGRAARAAGAGASYVAFGAFHPSPTKPAARLADPRVLAASRPLGLPLVAIGGITPDNAPALVAAGADLVAVVSGVFGAADPVAAARACADCFAAPPPRR